MSETTRCLSQSVPVNWIFLVSYTHNAENLIMKSARGNIQREIEGKFLLPWSLSFPVFILLTWSMSFLFEIHVTICGNKIPTRCNRWFLLQILLLAQHVSGTIMPIIRSSRVLYRWLLPVVSGAVKMENVICRLGRFCVFGIKCRALYICCI